MSTETGTVCIVGLGYVGLPLAHAFARKGCKVLGFDVNAERIKELKDGIDRTNELTTEQLKEHTITFSDDPSIIGKSQIVIMAIPTPVDSSNKPDLSLVEKATETVAEHMADDSIIVYESTVYPGVTEDICGPILKKSGKSFKLGYSPERINPGDKEHTVDKITKIVAGQDEATTKTLSELYGKVAPIHEAPSIKVAEMAKVIENAQRDLNIAYINEIAKLCNKLGIRSKDVLDAAKTKWNFLPFSPGLVGGHCIGVDPYYLIEVAKDKAEFVHLVEAARSTNSAMAQYVADQVTGKTVLVMGLTFKEDVPDDRNSGAADVVKILQEKGCIVTTCDPYVKPEQKTDGSYDAILLLVPHKEYREMTPQEFQQLANDNCLFYDLKSVFQKEDIEACGMRYAAL